MELKTISHLPKARTLLDKSLDYINKSPISPQQRKVLLNNAFSISCDPLSYLYSGCGAGWCEIDKVGKLVDIKYFSKGTSLAKSVHSDKETSSDWFFCADDTHRELLMSSGSKDQNILMFDFSPEDMQPLLLENGNIRVIVNLSGYSLYRF